MRTVSITVEGNTARAISIDRIDLLHGGVAATYDDTDDEIAALASDATAAQRREAAWQIAGALYGWTHDRRNGERAPDCSGSEIHDVQRLLEQVGNFRELA